MVQWAAAVEIAREAGVFTNLIFCLFGIYFWEVFQTSDFEWSLITRARKFSWPLVFFFFLCRYCMLFALVGLIAGLEVTAPINCNGLYIFNSLTGNLAILCASTSLMIRTVALWDRNRAIILVLAVIALAHWTILWRGMFIVDAVYSPVAKGCIIVSTNHIFLNASFFVTMGVDLIVLLLTVMALARKKMHSHLWKLLFQDGLVYFCVTFLCNSAPAILNVVNLNAMMDVIATIPAATISSIAACRLVMRLQNQANAPCEVYVHTPSMLSSRTRFSMGHHTHSVGRRPTPEVHVTTDSITVEDYPAVPQRAMRGSTKLSLDYESDVGYEK